LRFLVSAGPTREPIDDVRFLSNRSSGKMGYAIARALAKRGDVVLVSGPVSLKTPPGARMIPVETAREMHKTMQSEAKKADCIIMCAAVADYRPGHVVRGKIRKGGPRTLLLVRNVDILAGLGRMKGRPPLIGFALEADSLGVESAKRKLREKRLDAIVLNFVEAMGSDRSTGAIIRADGLTDAFEGVSKCVLARRIAQLAIDLAKTYRFDRRAKR